MEIRENIFYDCLMANLQIFIISSIGFMLFKFKVILLTLTKTHEFQVVGSAELKNLSKLVEFVFTPCLIFYNFIHVDLFAFGTWLPVCVLNLGKNLAGKKHELIHMASCNVLGWRGLVILFKLTIFTTQLMAN